MKTNLYTSTVRIRPISAKSFFDRISLNAMALSKLLIGKPIFDIQDCNKTEKREWFPEDRIMPPRCPYEDVLREEWIYQSYKLINHMRQHTEDSRISDSGGYAFMNFYEDEKLWLSISPSKNSYQGFQIIEIGICSDFNEEERETLKTKIVEMLKFEKYHIQQNISEKQSLVDESLILFSKKEDEEIGQKFKNLVHLHRREEKYLNYYAKSLQLASFKFNAIVKNLFNMNAQDYIDNERIKEMLGLIKYTNVSFSSLAEAFSFTDENELFEFFYERQGVDVRNYRSN